MFASPGPAGGELRALWAGAANDIWAVGRRTATGASSPLVAGTYTQHWDGQQWTLVPSPNVGAGGSRLFGVSGTAPADVWAVGFSYTGSPGVDRSLIEHWDGQQWSVVPSPNVGASDNDLYGVVALAADNAWAVGHYINTQGNYNTLTLHWDGATWQVVPSPNFGPSSNFLLGVAAVSPADLWAVGYTAYGTLTLHWDGTQWAQVPSASGYAFNQLEGVVALASDDVWAVGTYQENSQWHALAEHWDGTAWTLVPTPGQGISYFNFWDVAASGPDDVWAAGYWCNYCPATTLVEHWAGQAWEVVPSANQGTYNNRINSIVVAGPGDVWAVGGTDGGVLVERYNDPCTTPTPAQSMTPTATVSATSTPTPTVQPASTTPTATATMTPTAPPPTATPVVTAPPTLTPSAPSPTSSPLPSHTALAPSTTASRTAQASTPWPTAPAASVTPTRTAVGPPPTLPPTATPCARSFRDVQPADYFYGPVRYLACQGAIAGYADGTFRPYQPTTRAQLVKIVVLGFAKPLWTPPSGSYTFADVPPSQPFFTYIETASALGLVSGYACGAPGEPCDPRRRAYFRPVALVTRGQLAKITVAAAGWDGSAPPIRTFEDVLPGTAFYNTIETAACHGIISGYTCGGPGEPCIAPENRPYFRQYNSAVRGQIAKIVYLARTGSTSCGRP